MPPSARVATALARDPLPPAFDRLWIRLRPGQARRTGAAEWGDCLVMVERGTVEVECAGGTRRSFVAGDLLALGCLPVHALRNPGPRVARLLAVRRRAPTPVATQREGPAR